MSNSDWEEVVHEDGSVYYYNSITQETLWTLPEANTSKWEEFETDDGKKYYYNSETQETRWERPDEYETEDKEVGEYEQKEEEAEEEEEEDENEDTSDSKVIQKVTQLDEELQKLPVSKESDIDTDKKETYIDDSNEAFKQLLKDNNVDSTWSFQDIISKFITNPIYWRVDDALTRKKLYEDYLVETMKNEMSNKTETKKKFKNNFLMVLKEYKDKGGINHMTRWFSAKNKLLKDDNPIFKHLLLSDNEIYTIFKEFQDTLLQEYNDRILSEKNQALTELKSYLTKVNPSIVSETKDWDELYERLINDNRFKANKHFNCLHKIDILELYSKEIYPQTVDNIKQEIPLIEKQNYRNDRKAREAFKSLLGELPIEANTLFQDIFPLIEEEDAFIELCGRNGSTAIELFWDITSEKLQLLKVKTDLVRTIINKDEANILTNKETFLNYIKQSQDERLDVFKQSENELGIIYDNLKRSLEMRKQHKFTELYQSLQTAQNSFSYWMVSNYETNETIFKLISKSESSEVNGSENHFTIVKSDENPHYTLLESVNPHIFTEKANEIPELQTINSLLHQLLQNGSDTPPTFEQVITQCLHEFITKLNTNHKRKRDPEPESRKKQKVDKPVILNY